MSFLLAALTLVIDAALGAWLGVMAFFSFVGAPRAFAVYDERGGAYVSDVFPRYYRVGIGLGVAALVAGLLSGYLTRYDGATLVLLGLVGGAVLVAGYSLGVLIPKMEAAGDDGFDRFHRRSVILNGVMMLAVALALVASHVPA